MKDILKRFEYISDVPNRIDDLIDQAKHTKKHTEKHSLLAEAQDLASAYELHCREGGNDKKQFNPIV